MNLNTIKEAAHRIAPFIFKTPLLTSEEFNNFLGTKVKIYFKCENFQITRSFKLRGALNVLLQKSSTHKRFVCRSSGNFAQAMAYTGKKLGVSVKVVMPTNAPRVKVVKTASYGTEVVQFGTTHQEACQKLHEIVTSEKRVAISSFDNLDLIAGQGTVALEIFERLPTLKQFFCPMGGGGLMSGCATALKALNPTIETIAVEPEGAADFYASLKVGSPQKIAAVNTIADGLRAPSVGKNNWPLLKKNVNFVQLVSDTQIKQAMKLLFDFLGIMIEPSGATSLAGVLAYGPSKLTGDVVCVLSGGNVDKEQFLQWISEV